MCYGFKELSILPGLYDSKEAHAFVEFVTKEEAGNLENPGVIAHVGISQIQEL